MSSSGRSGGVTPSLVPALPTMPSAPTAGKSVTASVTGGGSARPSSIFVTATIPSMSLSAGAFRPTA
eukprot:8943477-Lingulodinium_polyedra.AAC.1